MFSERRSQRSFSSYTKVKWSEVKVTQSCPTLCNPVDYTVHGILQAWILEWVAFPFSRGSSQPRDWTQVSHIADRFFTSWATREAHHILRVHTINMTHSWCWASLVAQLVKNSPSMRETWVWSLGWEDPLEKDTGNPLQYFCLENPMDKGTCRIT